MDGDFSDDDLPPAFEVRESQNDATAKTRKGATSTNYRVEDLVWVKYRRSFWPAVVCQIFPREKKMKVMFVDTPDEKNLLKVPFRRVIAYNSSPKSRRMKYQVEMDGSPDREALKEAIEKVDQYLCKRALRGSGISPRKFFTTPYFYIGNLDISASFEVGSEDAVTVGDDDVNVKTNMDDNDDLDKDEKSDGQLGSPSESEEMTGSSTTSSLILIRTDNDDDKKQEERQSDETVCQAKLVAHRLLDAIKTEDCSSYLEELHKGKVESRRHQMFTCGTNSVRRRLKFEAGFGPFEDYAQQDALCRHLLETFKKGAGVAPHFDINAYLFEVLVPEAIMWALSKVLNVNPAQAEVMMQGTKLSSTKCEVSSGEVSSV